MKCEHCLEKPGTKIKVNIPVQPKGGGYGASFHPDGEETSAVVLCDDCIDNALLFCEKCGYVAFFDDVMVYADCQSSNWLCDGCNKREENKS